MKPKSVQNFLNSEDPLSNEAIEFLIDYEEEDNLVDFKVNFGFHEEKEWLEITKDIMAFANTHGGYLIFGVRDGTFDIVGLDEDVTNLLADSDKILQKINRHLEPPISLLRSKKFIKDGKQIVGLFIPISYGITHVISKDGSFKYPSGDEKVVLRKGTIYVRRSAGNHLADDRDIDGIINRRMEYFKDSLLDKITRVVEAPAQSDVIVMSHEPNAEGDQKFVIDDDPEAIPVKGMSFTTPPQTTEQEIASWISLFSLYKNTIPPNQALWAWYKKRHSVKLVEKHRVMVAEFCILSGVPPFFWLQGCSNRLIKVMIKDAMENRPSALEINPILNVTAFLGKRFYNSVLKSIDKSNVFRKDYPSEGPRSSYRARNIEELRVRNEYSEEQLRSELESNLTEIAAKLSNPKKEESYNILEWKADCIDCYLYAQDNKYE